jgi:hypothetical protein
VNEKTKGYAFLFIKSSNSCNVPLNKISLERALLTITYAAVDLRVESVTVANLIPLFLKAISDN